jgi:hypothetical protein
MIANVSMIAPPTARAHAMKRRDVADPRLDDALAAATAISLDLSVSGLKHLERAGEVSKTRASRWTKEGKGNPLFDVTRIVYLLMKSGQHAGVIAAHVLTTLAQGLMPIADAELVRRFWMLMGSESDVEGKENRLQATFSVTGDLEGLERATLDEAGVAHELAATIRELRRRNIDPRRFG